MDFESLISALKETDFLYDMELEDLQRVAKISSLCHFDAGDIIFRDGGPASCVYLMVRGQAALDFGKVGQECRRFLTAAPGKLLAWPAILEHPRLTANARALTPALLVKISSPHLADLCDEHPAFGYQIMRRAARALANRLAATRLQLLELHHLMPPANAALSGAAT